MDTVLNSKINRVTDRALKIYCATKNEDKKAVIERALSTEIPPEFFNIATREIQLENGEGTPDNG